jgi:hypothetical protein
MIVIKCPQSDCESTDVVFHEHEVVNDNGDIYYCRNCGNYFDEFAAIEEQMEGE